MNKYRRVFQLSFSELTSYRLNFFLGRIRSIIVLLLLFALYGVLTREGDFAGYTAAEFLTYISIIHLLRAWLFASQNRNIASEINNGTLSVTLIRPIRYIWFAYSRELAERCILLSTAILELLVFFLIIKQSLLAPVSLGFALLFLASVFLAHILYIELSYLVSFFAFWSREAGGPRFVFDWFLEFASGAYFPLSILPLPFFLMLQTLPFLHLIFSPLQIYLGKVNLVQSLSILMIQMVWIVLVGVLLNRVWKNGLKRFSGEGI